MSKEIQLTKGMVAVVDDADYEWLSQWKWCYSGRCAVRKGDDGLIRMHRLIMNAPDGKVVDHINGNPLDNRRENLRLATQQENCRNQRRHDCKHPKPSRFKGVTRLRHHRKSGAVWETWRARIVVDAKQINLGLFKDEEDAARAYDEAAIEYFGEFAKLNFPPQE